MLNHPAYIRHTAGAAILAAVEGKTDLLYNASDVYALGTRYKEVRSRSGVLRYSLDGFEHIDADGTRTRFYVLAGGKGSARTVLDANGEPTLHAERGNGRGLSPEFREWIAAAVARDSGLV